MKFDFPNIEPPPGVNQADWLDWKWQFRSALKTQDQFGQYFNLTPEEKLGFEGLDRLFQVRVTPYYARLAQSNYSEHDPIRKIIMPHKLELLQGEQQMLDPLGEKKNNPAPRIIHRYPDRVLFLVTDYCSVYCRYCTRKHFTGQGQSFASQTDYCRALDYISNHKEICEVILSGGDPLTLSTDRLRQVLSDLRRIEHVEIIRIGSRIPVVAPMRIDQELVEALKPYGPVFIMTHFNHPKELTDIAAQGISQFVDNGIPVFNQMVLLNGVNNHPSIVKALSRRLLYLRAKPYYMFQCDPSEGTDHLRTSIEDSMEIQKALWGKMSGLAMPNLSVDIPDGGGKVGIVPDYQVSHEGNRRSYKGWDGVEANYVSPSPEKIQKPVDWKSWS